MSDYVVHTAFSHRDFGNLDRKAKNAMLKERVASAKSAGLLSSRGTPLAIR